MLILHLSQLLVVSRLRIKQPAAFLLKEIDLQGPLLEDKVDTRSSSLSPFHSMQKTTVDGMRQ